MTSPSELFIRPAAYREKSVSKATHGAWGADGVIIRVTSRGRGGEVTDGWGDPVRVSRTQSVKWVFCPSRCKIHVDVTG